MATEMLLFLLIIHLSYSEGSPSRCHYQCEQSAMWSLVTNTRPLLIADLWKQPNSGNPFPGLEVAWKGPEDRRTRKSVPSPSRTRTRTRTENKRGPVLEPLRVLKNVEYIKK